MKKNRLTILVLFVCVVMLAGLFVYLKPEQQAVSTAGVEYPKGVLSSTPAPFVINLAIENKKLKDEENQRIQVKQGENIDFRITSDIAGEFHLHGYDISGEVSKEPLNLKFIADKVGRFEFEIHEFGEALGALEVLPK